MKENKNDMSDVKDVFDEMKCNIRVTTLRRLGNLAKQKHTTSADNSRLILVELQSDTEHINILRAARNLKGTKFSKIFFKKWLSNGILIKKS